MKTIGMRNKQNTANIIPANIVGIDFVCPFTFQNPIWDNRIPRRYKYKFKE